MAMRDRGLVGIKVGLAILAGVLAVTVMLGANLFDIDHVKMLALAVLALAVAVVVP